MSNGQVHCLCVWNVEVLESENSICIQIIHYFNFIVSSRGFQSTSISRCFMKCLDPGIILPLLYPLMLEHRGNETTGLIDCMCCYESTHRCCMDC